MNADRCFDGTGWEGTGQDIPFDQEQKGQGVKEIERRIRTILELDFRVGLTCGREIGYSRGTQRQRSADAIHKERASHMTPATFFFRQRDDVSTRFDNRRNRRSGIGPWQTKKKKIGGQCFLLLLVLAFCVMQSKALVSTANAERKSKKEGKRIVGFSCMEQSAVRYTALVSIGFLVLFVSFVSYKVGANVHVLGVLDRNASMHGKI